MTRKDPLEVRRRELQNELKSALRRRIKLEQKIGRLKDKLHETRRAEETQI